MNKKIIDILFDEQGNLRMDEAKLMISPEILEDTDESNVEQNIMDYITRLDLPEYIIRKNLDRFNIKLLVVYQHLGISLMNEEIIPRVIEQAIEEGDLEVIDFALLNKACKDDIQTASNLAHWVLDDPSSLVEAGIDLKEIQIWLSQPDVINYFDIDVINDDIDYFHIPNILAYYTQLDSEDVKEYAKKISFDTLYHLCIDENIDISRIDMLKEILPIVAKNERASIKANTSEKDSEICSYCDDDCDDCTHIR